MKKTGIIWLAALLLFVGGYPCPGKAESPDLPLAIYRGVIGRVSFALPGVPQRIADQDYPGLWKNSVQLFGIAMDGAEFQLRTADISEWIAGFEKTYPDKEPFEWKAQALLSYSLFMINNYKGEMTNPVVHEEDGLVYAVYDYTYPDTPGVAYVGKAILDGSQAISLTGAKSKQMDKAFDLLLGLSVQEAASLPPAQPQPWSKGCLSAVFPDTFHVRDDGQSILAFCFTRDFDYLHIEAIPLAIDPSDKQGDALAKELESLAQRVMLPAINGKTVSNATVHYPAGDTVMLSFNSVNTKPFGEQFGQRFLGRLILSQRGTYYIWAPDSPGGQAFMDSLFILPVE